MKIESNLDLLYDDVKHINIYVKRSGIPTAESVYGEITRNGVEMLLSHYSSFFNKETVFYDIGSGLGKFTYHLAISKQIKQAIGVEINPLRFEHALSRIDNFEYSSLEKPLFLNQDCFETNFDNANVVYWDNTCFDSKKIDNLTMLLPKGCLFLCCNWRYDTEIQLEKSPIKYETTYASKRSLFWKVI